MGGGEKCSSDMGDSIILSWSMAEERSSAPAVGMLKVGGLEKSSLGKASPRARSFFGFGSRSSEVPLPLLRGELASHQAMATFERTNQKWACSDLLEKERYSRGDPCVK